jgi:hypothetical protein
MIQFGSQQLILEPYNHSWGIICISFAMVCKSEFEKAIAELHAKYDDCMIATTDEKFTFGRIRMR